jgi:hypothetical protein
MTRTDYVFIPEDLVKGLPTRYRPDGQLPYITRDRYDELSRKLTILEKLITFVRHVALPALEEGLAAGKKHIIVTWHECAKRVPCSEDVIAKVKDRMQLIELRIRDITAILRRAKPWQPMMN